MKTTALLLVTGLLVIRCVPPGQESSDGAIDWSDFRASVYQEPATGVFIVDGDTPIDGEKQLMEFHAQHLSGTEPLAVHRWGPADAKWSDQAKRNLTYCVSAAFGPRHAAVVAAMNASTAAWESAADVDFIHRGEYDGSCSASNGQVSFDVNPTNEGEYLARAFFPGQPRVTRNVLIDLSAFSSATPLAGILRHELGHALGFRHEHTRPESGQCFEDRSWRALTSYDSRSVMHYLQCGGTNVYLELSTLDRQGAAALYGAPRRTPPPPPAAPTQIESASGKLLQGERDRYVPVPVVPGTLFEAEMTGSGDPDLYLQFGTTPTMSSFDCRPYADHARESCSLTVPSGESEAYVMVRGFTDSAYTVTVRWTRP